MTTGKYERRRIPVEERISKKYVVNEETGCWEFTGSRSWQGYGQIRGSGPKARMFQAHRISYEIHRGPIPDNLVLDHLCVNPCCINPSHLQIVTRAENTRRAANAGANFGAHNRGKKHCPHGHDYDEENTVWYKGTRRCRACAKVHAKKTYYKHHESRLGRIRAYNRRK